MDFFCFRPSIGSSRSVSSTFPPPAAVKSARLTKRLHLPEYITQTNTGLFVFRMKVPSDCRHVLHRSVFKFSLRTRCIYTARKHVASLLQYLDSFFVEVRAGAFVDAPVDIWETLKSICPADRHAWWNASVSSFRDKGRPCDGCKGLHECGQCSA